MTSDLDIWFNLTLSMSSLKVKITGQRMVTQGNWKALIQG